MSIALVNSALRTTDHFLNQPIVKERIKNVASALTFTGGLFGAYDIYQVLRGREISTEIDLQAPQWKQTVQKMIMMSAKISLILSATISRPGAAIISNIVGRVWTPTQLERAFGPHTIFAVNPWHPRHVVSIAAVIFAMPSLIQTAYLGTYWVYKKVRQVPEAPLPINDNVCWLTDAKVRLMIISNTLTSRLILHMGNQFSQFLLRH